MRLIIVALVILLGGGFAWLLVPWPLSPPEITQTGDAKRGEYLLRLGGCVACHTDAKGGGQFLAGGRALKTAFGTFTRPTSPRTRMLASVAGRPAPSSRP